MCRYILSIDQGTSGTKALLFDDSGRFVRRYNAVHRQYYPHSGWVEQDADEVFQNTVSAIDMLIAESGVNPMQIAAVSITNQRETVVVWDKRTGKPVANAIVWQCNRGTDICETLARQGYGDFIRKQSGLVLSPYYSASKVKWLLNNIKGARDAAVNGDLLMGTMDSWLMYKLTEGAVHATDVSNASRTQLMDIEKLCWDDELLNIFGIPHCMMPEIHSSDHIFGTLKVSCLAQFRIPIAGAIGDSHAALFGQNCFERGMAKVTYGTGSSIMMNIGNTPYFSEKGLVTSVGWSVGGETVYVAEGNINCSADTIKWLVEDLELITNAESSEAVAQSVADTGGVYLVPAFVGLGTPYWDSEATALITGMTRGTKKAHVVRAACECIGYQVKDIIDIMTAEAGVSLKEIRVDGGASRNNFIMQFQSDILGVNVAVNRVEEICALGAAYIAGIAIGFWELKELGKLRTNDTYFTPQMDSDIRNELYEGWKKAVRRTLQKV